jgi:hypothetical protein
MRVHARLIAAIAVVGMMGITACSGSGSPSSSSRSTTTTVPGSVLGGPPSSTTTTAPPFPVLAVTPTTIAPSASVGTTVAIPGTDRNAPELVTLLNVIDPATGADQFSTPVAGGKFVGVQIRITIGGTAITREDPSANTTVTDSQGNVYTPTPANIQTCAAIKPARSVAPGKSLTGCLTFQLESDSRVTHITYTAGGSQFGSVSADWQR